MYVQQNTMDVVGVGVGPANLSLAALLDPCRDIRARFFEQRKEFQWHAGLMLPNAMLQVAFLKDLVSPVDPTSRHSFLAFLKKKQRIYAFINANFPQVMRCEFNEYLRWVCDNVSSLEFDCAVDAVTVDGNGLRVHHQHGNQQTRHLVMGIGQKPYVPTCAAPYLGSKVIHASDYLYHKVQPGGRRVAVIGGGQTGAEMVLHLLSDTRSLPSEMFWISRRWNFHPLDETPFTNELFTPSYSDYFFGMTPKLQQEMLIAQHMASDGISPALLEVIYRKLYELRFLQTQPCAWQLRPGRELVSMSPVANANRLVLHHKQKNTFESIDADLVILCTGHELTLPSCLDPIKQHIRLSDGQFVVKKDFSIECDLPNDCRIYVQNGARNQRGIADPNLSLLAWRSAKIANSIIDRPLYDIDDPHSFVGWDAAVEAPAGETSFPRRSAVPVWNPTIDQDVSRMSRRAQPSHQPAPGLS